MADSSDPDRVPSHDSALGTVAGRILSLARDPRPLLLVLRAFVFIALLNVLVAILVSQTGAMSVGEFGDLFGASNALFAGISTLLLIATLVLQGAELADTRREVRRQADALEEQTTAIAAQTAALRAQLAHTAAATREAILPVLSLVKPKLVAVWSEKRGVRILVNNLQVCAVGSGVVRDIHLTVSGSVCGRSFHIPDRPVVEVVSLSSQRVYLKASDLMPSGSTSPEQISFEDMALVSLRAKRTGWSKQWADLLNEKPTFGVSAEFERGQWEPDSSCIAQGELRFLMRFKDGVANEYRQEWSFRFRSIASEPSLADCAKNFQPLKVVTETDSIPTLQFAASPYFGEFGSSAV